MLPVRSPVHSLDRNLPESSSEDITLAMATVVPPDLSSTAQTERTSMTRSIWISGELAEYEMFSGPKHVNEEHNLSLLLNNTAKSLNDR